MEVSPLHDAPRRVSIVRDHVTRHASIIGCRGSAGRIGDRYWLFRVTC
jgi:hypothetical protein